MLPKSTTEQQQKHQNIKNHQILDRCLLPKLNQIDPKWEGTNWEKHWKNLALGSLGAHVSHKAAQVAQGSSKLSPRGAQTAQNWTPRDTQNPQNLTFEHHGMGTKNEPAKGHPKPSKCKPLSLKRPLKSVTLVSSGSFLSADEEKLPYTDPQNGTNLPTTQ